MKKQSNKKNTRYFLGILSAYIILQFLWWGFMLITENPNKATMVIGEGSVFLIILIYGIWRYQLSMQRELSLHQRQSNFLLSVTHELKTPISSVQLILQTIIKHELEPDQIRVFLEKALDENKKSESLIQNMLHAASLENQRIELFRTTIRTNEFNPELMKQLQDRFPDAAIRIKSPNPFIFQADRFMLESVLIHLVENSIKYGAQHVVIELEEATNRVIIQVADDGIGINEADRPFIYDKFYRSGDENKREKPGTGLGLFIAKQFIELHQGTLIYKEQLPNGSIFTITLPK
jgi:two-component system phosphate regulon sensor histidine kinase PhoR